jgi:hypothetical protein
MEKVVRSANGGMTREGDLGMGSEDVDVAFLGRRVGWEMQEYDFGEVELGGYRLLLFLGEAFFGGCGDLDNCERIARERGAGEDIEGGEVELHIA